MRGKCASSSSSKRVTAAWTEGGKTLGMCVGFLSEGVAEGTRHMVRWRDGRAGGRGSGVSVGEQQSSSRERVAAEWTEGGEALELASNFLPIASLRTGGTHGGKGKQGGRGAGK